MKIFRCQPDASPGECVYSIEQLVRRTSAQRTSRTAAQMPAARSAEWENPWLGFKRRATV